MENIIIKPVPSFEFEDKATKAYYGLYKIAPKYQLLNLQPGFSFTLENTALISVEKNDYLNGLEFRKRILSDGRIPLDAYCAKAIYDNKEACRELSWMWWQTFGGIHTPHHLETVNFLGSLMVDSSTKVSTSGMPHIISIEYPGYIIREEPVLKAFESRDIGWWRYRDYAIVFSKNFAKKHFNN